MNTDGPCLTMTGGTRPEAGISKSEAKAVGTWRKEGQAVSEPPLNQVSME